MLITASSKFIRVSPRKLRLVADAIRHLSPQEALVQLKHLHKNAAEPLAKAIKQAVGNAVNNFNLQKETLKFKTLTIDGGPTYKRFQPVSRGRAHTIFKRTSHIKVVLESAGEKVEKKMPAVKVVKKETAEAKKTPVVKKAPAAKKPTAKKGKK